MHFITNKLVLNLNKLVLSFLSPSKPEGVRMVVGNQLSVYGKYDTGLRECSNVRHDPITDGLVLSSGQKVE